MPCNNCLCAECAKWRQEEANAATTFIVPVDPLFDRLPWARLDEQQPAEGDYCYVTGEDRRRYVGMSNYRGGKFQGVLGVVWWSLIRPADPQPDPAP